ncbi:Rieske 2Fe-2S domain-containing protein [Nguyenibacter sp. L1]|uniref:Rieske 2Fe-2S domain-containing protein n=1 Tax=Nguyenibacter sp. L1 TaxID=3049350 RepID=UPI002B470CDC|nr:Rieske 2Fe-2S domain-containing protein [Nguyenibacter sp. L1]WRH88597.1 Rieske 2Fe-2S domain-containing protein [Nguyenibacter sp. L1]
MTENCGRTVEDVRLCAVADVQGGPRRVVAGDRGLVVWIAADGAPRVFADRCPHRDARLSAGHVEAGRLVCPFHLWAFDADGRHVGPDGVANPDCRVPRFACRVRDGAVWVEMDAMMS